MIVKNINDGIYLQGTHDISLGTSSLPNGIYFVRVLTPAGSGTAKLMVLK
jgi:hypothetical protein